MHGVMPMASHIAILQLLMKPFRATVLLDGMFFQIEDHRWTCRPYQAIVSLFLKNAGFTFV